MKHLIIDKTMKEIWPDTRVGCLQYRVKVEKKNEERRTVEISEERHFQKDERCYF